jgi:hypothetical protein
MSRPDWLADEGHESSFHQAAKMAPATKFPVQLAIEDLMNQQELADKAFRSDFIAAHFARLPKGGECG